MAKITWIHHASVLIEGEKRVYIDPWKLEALQAPAPADLVLITHDHFDHLSVEDLQRITTAKTEILVPAEALDKLDAVAGKRRGVRPGETLVAAGLAVEVVPAYNVNKKFHPKDAKYVGYVVTVDGERIYHAGDTDQIEEMKGLAPDVALLPIGGTYTMTAPEAAKAVAALGAKRAVPIHFGSIVGRQEDAAEFKALCQVPVDILKPVA
jgi:L-ascorbate metabolism protein UlaG (beta-lactamase superfamily)